MPGQRAAARLREEMLRRRGLAVGRSGKLTPKPPVKPGRSPPSRSDLTLAMRLLEEQYGKPIVELISVDQNIMEVSRRLGIDKGLISRWRKRLGLRQ